MLITQIKLTVTKVWMLCLTMLLFACTQDQNQDTVPDQELSDTARFVKEQLALYPDNNFETLIQEYGEPAWEYARLNGFIQNQRIIIPLQQDGLIHNILVYKLYEANGTTLPFEILNTESINSAEVSKRYMNSMLFHSFYREGANVNKETLTYALRGLADGNMDVRPNVKMHAKQATANKISNSAPQFIEIRYDLSHYFFSGDNCNRELDTEYLANLMNEYAYSLQDTEEAFVDPEEWIQVYYEFILIPLNCEFVGNIPKSDLSTVFEFDLIPQFMDNFLLYLDDATMLACSETVINESSHVYYNYYMELDGCGGISGGFSSDPDYVYTGTGYTDPPGGPAGDPEPEEDEEEDKIINELNDKADCVYQSLIRTAVGQHNLIRDTFLYFGGGNPFNNNLIYRTESNLRNDEGDMILGSFDLEGSNYIVTLNEDQLENRSPLEIATTILHESVHALLRNQYLNGNESFLSLFGDYMETQVGSNNITHAIMRDYYVLPISNVLQQFDNYSEDTSVYESLAWEGLHQFLSQEEIEFILLDIDYIRSKGLQCN